MILYNIIQYVSYIFNLVQTGTTCDQAIPCFDENFCQNNGTCVVTEDNQSSCQCNEFFTGDNCEIELPCRENRCVFGQCIDGVDLL